MNQPNNKRRKQSQEKIERAFVEFIQTKEINEITVTDICKKTNLNRSTFYANYLDIYDLADKIKEKLEMEIHILYQEERENQTNSNDFLKLFRHIKDNQIFYKTFFKLEMDKAYLIYEYDSNLSKKLYNDRFIDYHIEFFMAGFNAVVKKWLYGGCQETPEEIESILKEEYKNKESH